MSSSTLRSDRSHCWRVLANVSRWPTWLKTVTSVVPLDGEQLRIDARFLVTQPRLGSAVWRVTQLVPGVSFSWERSMPGLRIVGRHELHGLAQRECFIRLTVEISGLLTPLAVAVAGKTTREYINAEAAALASRVQATVLQLHHRA